MKACSKWRQGEHMEINGDVYIQWWYVKWYERSTGNKEVK